jgi:hypothetical protein
LNLDPGFLLYWFIGVPRGGDVNMASFWPGKNKSTNNFSAPNRIHNNRTRQTNNDEMVNNACQEANTPIGIKQLENITESLTFLKNNHLGKDLKWYPRRFFVSFQQNNLKGSQFSRCPLYL